MSQHPLSADHDLQWLAFQYVAGELSAADAAAFELRMLDDLDACEAVIRSMQTCEAVAATFQQPSKPLARDQSRERAVVSFGRRSSVVASVTALAAVAALVVSINIQQNAAATAQNAELVRMWSTTSEEVLATDESDSSESAVAADLSVPDWLMAAVEARQEQDEDDVIEN